MSPSRTKGPPANVSPKDFVEEPRVGFHRSILVFLFVAYGFLLLSTVSIFFLQGFRLGGFYLDPALLKWLGGATIGEIGGLLYLTFKASMIK